jgi:hypothetical protein
MLGSYSGVNIMGEVSMRLFFSSALAEISFLDIFSSMIKTFFFGLAIGTIGKLFMDDGFANNLDKTLLNVKKGTQGFSENMEAAKKSIFLKGAFKKDKDK